MTVNLPYFRDASLLPGPLPTDEEIENATTVLPSIRNPATGRIVLIRNKFVVKYGRSAIHTENEGHALLFVEKHLDIPAPILYAMYRKGKVLYIIMEYIPGESLEDLWPTLSKLEKESVLGQLRVIFDKMRALPPQKFFGSVTGGPMEHAYFWTLEKDPEIGGPFETEKQLNFALAKHSRLNWEHNHRHPWLAEFYERNLPNALKDHQSIFTHGDLQQKNILIRKHDGGYLVSGLVDWQTAGWYPSYWEYGVMFCSVEWMSDWPESLEKIVDPWPLEAAMLRFVHQDLLF